jgi:hypothetical protein
LSTTVVQESQKRTDLRRDVRLSPEAFTRLEFLMHALGTKTKSKTFEKVLDEFARKNPEVLENKIATFENVMSEPAPVCVHGLPGSGKSFTLRRLVLQAFQSGMSCILVDVAGEHMDPSNPDDPLRRKIKASSAANKRFGKGLYRIVVDKDPKYRDLSIERLFENLNVLAFKGKLRDFFIGIDEGNEFSQIKAVRDFIIESRKFVQKCVVVSADPAPYAPICVLMHPRPKSSQSQ